MLELCINKGDNDVSLGLVAFILSTERRKYISYFTFFFKRISVATFTVLPANSDSDVMFCLQSYHGLIIDRSLVY